MRFPLLIALLLSTGLALAQTKSAPAGAPAAPQSAPQATQPAPAKADPAKADAARPDPATAAKEAAAAKVAGDWLVMIDQGDYAKAWEACSPLFREKVSKQQWVDGIPRNRAEYGALRSRKLEATAYRPSMPGAPEGEYVAVRFASDYEKRSPAEEVVTLALQGGAWRPIGYLLR